MRKKFVAIAAALMMSGLVCGQAHAEEPAIEIWSETEPETHAADDDGSWVSLGRYKLTAYCSCRVCCGRWSGGPTASGAYPNAGRTVAVSGLPFGTHLMINGQEYVVEDRGVRGAHIDIYMRDHQTARNFGVQYAEVYRWMPN